ncbi:MAG TPA: hypothetical protein VFS40_07185 [Gemmatimonadales bacterium]|nr:hypothetical protein [Gemmatimonadales bacterium]
MMSPLLRLVALAALALAPAGALQAQQSIQPIGTAPAPTPDAARAKVRGALVALGDSLQTVSAAIARIERAPGSPSDALQLSRARVMGRACGGAATQLVATRRMVRESAIPGARVKAAQAEYLRALDKLHGTLGWCDSTFLAMSQPGKAEEAREWGMNRASRVRAALAEYQQVLLAYGGALGIDPTRTSEHRLLVP